MKQKEGKEGGNISEAPKLSQEELDFIKATRDYNKRYKDCQQALVEVLNKFNADIIVDLDSPVGRPTVKVTLK